MIARKIAGPNGEFLGVIGRGIEPANFEKFFATVALGPDADDRDASPRRHPSCPLSAPRCDDRQEFQDHGPANVSSRYSSSPAARPRLTSPIDGNDRLISSRALSKFPIVIVATHEDIGGAGRLARADQHPDRGRPASVLAIAVLLFLVVRKLSQQHRASQQRLTLEKQRLDTAVNNMTQGLLLFDSEQRLVICNQRYIEMYGLSADVVKPGCSFRDVIAHRKADRLVHRATSSIMSCSCCATSRCATRW